MKKKIILLACLLFVFIMGISVTSYASSNVKLSNKSILLAKGSKYKLKVKGTNKKASWSSSNTKVVTVSDNGTVQAVNIGKATVQALIAKKTYKCKVEVMSKDDISYKVIDIYSWTCGDIWNDGFCDIYHYVESGTNSVGGRMNIRKTVKNVKKALKQKKKYNTFMKRLQGKKYKRVKKVWGKIYVEMNILQSCIEDEMPRYDEDYYFPHENFGDYIWDFLSEAYSL
ncbi:Ig-like domain (group 2) [Eubacterium uniforme]|uniref:Ig-like domain (Group 2) n=1 Tax=Eubacterium uniforme TaxID=39495 RepID=A0A1T4VWK6_9FIRM|nr:Ig-like domain-containing protein [Eubacterium uniforme]SKA69400.1 Ig-like domain (group 2) [Eubacterium uniforme]